MITRSVLKENAKRNLKGTWFWNTIIVAIITVVITGGSSVFQFTERNSDVLNFDLSKYLSIGISATLISIFLFSPLLIGVTKYYIEIGKGKKPGLSIIFEPFKNYIHNVVAMIILGLVYFVLGIILAILTIFSFAIPILGILVFAVVYGFSIYVLIRLSLVLYCYADDDESMLGAISQSWELLDGKVLEMFILNLSFILWYLLAGLTFGLAGIYVIPYERVTIAMYYLELNY